MQDDQLIALVQDALDNMKAKEIVVLDVRGRSSVTDYMIVASGTSKRQVSSAAQEVVEKAKASGLQPMGVEGEQVGDWVLVDLGSVIVHVMMPDARSFYDIERLWSPELDA
ncbi:ribosome silencing factor [Marinobacterium sp. LSUCC0821]|jgi:ribosome-associated protein|uniref:ribosome silencing factor n=1 Tax=Marinobacterium sp. LSUCC0821 TaxID=2668067 RepID=UPI001451D588|nr:ribosome silencing factor [Marinobacterium sp. LSUCC0821]QJD70210.1 ribosome silencing factor [Marinobacterium sp. LSUCC0821]